MFSYFSSLRSFKCNIIFSYAFENVILSFDQNMNFEICRDDSSASLSVYLFSWSIYDIIS